MRIVKIIKDMKYGDIIYKYIKFKKNFLLFVKVEFSVC